MAKFNELAASQKKSILERIKFIVKTEAAIAPKQEKIGSAKGELKTMLITWDCSEVDSRAGKAALTIPTSKVCDNAQLLRALTPEELDVLMPRSVNMKVFNAKLESDPEFAARVAGCFTVENGAQRLTVKAA
jgi:hypothetical protein